LPKLSRLQKEGYLKDSDPMKELPKDICPVCKDLVTPYKEGVRVKQSFSAIEI
jgi:hypothetical protein